MSGDCKDCGEKLTTCCLNCFEEQFYYTAISREAITLRQQRDALLALLDRALTIVTFAVHEHGITWGKMQPGWEGCHDLMTEMEAALSQCERGDGEPQEPAP